MRREKKSQRGDWLTNLSLKLFRLLLLNLPTPPFPAYDGEKGENNSSYSTARDGSDRDMERFGGLVSERGSW